MCIRDRYQRRVHGIIEKKQQMKRNIEDENDTVYVKKPLKFVIPHFGDSQSSKNPFFHSLQSYTMKCPVSQKIKNTFEETPDLEIHAAYTLSTNFTRQQLKTVRVERTMPISPDMGDCVSLQTEWITESDWDILTESVDEGFAIQTIESNANSNEVQNLNIESDSNRYAIDYCPEVNFNFEKLLKAPFISQSEINLKGIFLPKTHKPKKRSNKTLLLDLDDTLIHAINKSFDYSRINIVHKNIKTIQIEDELTHEDREIQFIIRPYAIEFLKKLSSIYEIVIFTAALPIYAKEVLNILDPKKKFISYQIYLSLIHI
eukprot:TRINITY_DN1217_c0_g1_i4.p1 TRINITY_DN1217_c0_g1~~TRINITY_DN1217_c0_g1_i4.p1  ORF type:complete len:316 (-),score=64.45 TRINITY_DN1217_c0_g1_i4:53-1000(-)